MDPLQLMLDLVMPAAMLREAAASCALDGDTQSEPPLNAIKFVQMSDGEIVGIRICDLSMPWPKGNRP